MFSDKIFAIVAIILTMDVTNAQTPSTLCNCYTTPGYQSCATVGCSTGNGNSSVNSCNGGYYFGGTAYGGSAKGCVCPGYTGINPSLSYYSSCAAVGAYVDGRNPNTTTGFTGANAIACCNFCCNSTTTSTGPVSSSINVVLVVLLLSVF